MLLLCPRDLSPCQRTGCGQGHCKRTGEVPFTPCIECGAVVHNHRLIAVCVECLRRYAVPIEEGN